MRVRILGSGTSQGVPVIACKCEVCQSTDPRDDRKRSSILVEYNDYTLVVDTGPDFRAQMLENKVDHLDAVLFTHEHKDHVAGLDDVRAFNFKTGGKPMEVFATEQVQEALKREYAYIFAAIKYPGVPQIKLHTVENKAFSMGEHTIIPIEVMHYKLPVMAYRFGDFAYVTDANFIAEEELEKLKGLDLLVLNALRKSEHISHFNLEQAIQLIERLKPKRALLTHISHLMGKHEEVMKELPPHIQIAYDGQEIVL